MQLYSSEKDLQKEEITLPIGSWGLDLLYNTYLLTFIGALHNTSIVKFITKTNHYEFYYMNRPFNKVEICGILVNKKLAKTKGY